MLSADQTIIFYLFFFFQCIWFSHVLRVREKQSARTLGMRLKERKKDLAPFLCQPSSTLQSNLFIFPVGIFFIRSLYPSVFFFSDMFAAEVATATIIPFLLDSSLSPSHPDFLADRYESFYFSFEIISFWEYLLP